MEMLITSCPDPRLGCSVEIIPAPYIGPASLGLTNLLLTDPITSVPTGLRISEARTQALPFLPV
jgi:hypothetical protein